VAPGIEIGGIWPPVGLEHAVIDPFDVPLLNTVLLLSSGVSVTAAHHSLLASFSVSNEKVALFLLKIKK